MALIKMLPVGNGGELSKTTLWTNPDPTVQFCPDSSAYVDIELSSNMTNYQFLEFIFQKTTTNTDTFSMLIPVSDFILTESGAGAGKIKYVANVATSSYWTIFRTFCYSNNITVRMEKCLFYRANSATTNYNTYAIPLYIKGVNT